MACVRLLRSRLKNPSTEGMCWMMHNRLLRPALAGSFDGPAAVVTAPSGDLFVADADRVVKFSKDGAFVKTWGAEGSARGEFSGLHTIAVDSKGRLFVGDRGNNRIQIFDHNGTFLDEWKEFSRPTSIYIDRGDTMYVSDPQSNVKLNPGAVPTTDDIATQGFEGIAVDFKGSVYGVEVVGERARKYVRQ